jgi:hypothetical protein
MSLTNLKELLLNFLLVFLSLLITIAAAEIGMRLFYEKFRPEYYFSSEQLIKFDSIGRLNHHKRALDPKLLNEGKVYYSVYRNEGKSLRNQIIFQGDSWAELLDRIPSFSEKMLNFSSIFINGGTGSYAPSLMEVQLNDIISETTIKPNLIIAFIDQTDFMDEVCDYSKKRLEKDGKLIAVLKSTDILPSRSSNEYANYTFHANSSKLLFFLQNRISLISDKYNLNNDKYRSKSSCTWNDITKFMRGDTTDMDNAIFVKSLSSYLNTALSYSGKVILLTHKHRRHIEGLYLNDINMVLNKAVQQLKLSDKVTVIDITEEKIDDIDNIFPSHITDPASHPHTHYFRDNISPKILNLVLNLR